MKDMEDTAGIDFSQARSTFEAQEKAVHQRSKEPVPPKKDVKNNVSETPPVGYLAHLAHWCAWLRQLWLSKWPGWPGFWRSRYSGLPIALIFSLYVYYLLVCVLLPANVQVERQWTGNKSSINKTLIFQQMK